MDKRQQEIHAKRFDMIHPGQPPTDYGKMKVGVKTVDDAIIDLGLYPQLEGIAGRRFITKKDILNAAINRDYKMIRIISDFFYRTNGIYQSLVDFYATMYRWDWYIAGTVYDQKIYDSDSKTKKITDEFFDNLEYLDNTHIKKLCGDIAHKVIKFGVCYGIIIEGEDGMLFQELPPEYCRVRYSINNLPAVEFNMAYFDEHFHDVNYRLRVLKMFPKDVQRGYLLYREGKLAPDFVGDVGSWYLLEPGTAVKFSLNGLGDLPIFYNMIPSLLTLDAAQDLDQRKQMQDLLKIIVQKLPLDKNGDLLFDVSEAMDLHNNAVAMLQHAIGTDIITTFCDIDSIDLSDTRDNDSDDLERVERSVYNAAGVPEDLFNSSSNLSLNSSILRTAGIMQDLKLQFETMFDSIIQHRHETTRKSYKFKFYILDTTQYNYTEFSKMYKDQMQVGYGKLFAQIALGHSQSSILSTMYFENKVLNLSQIMIPPLTSATINGEDVQNLGKTSSINKKKTQTTTEGATSSDNTGGRPKKDERELSDKSIQNRESQ